MTTNRIIGIKRDTSEAGARRAGGSVPQKCGDCLFFKGDKSPSFDAPCFDRGVKEYATAPRCFSPNLRKLSGISSDAFELLGSILSMCSPSQVRIISNLIAQQHLVVKQGFFLMQPVFFRIGDDYLDNYFKGYVMSLTSEGDIMMCSSPYLRGGHVAYAQVTKASLLDEVAMEEKRAYLVERGLIYEPKRPQRNTNVEDEDYVIPTIEMSSEALEELTQEADKRRRKKAGIDDSKEQPKKRRRKDMSSGEYIELDITGRILAGEDDSE